MTARNYHDSVVAFLFVVYLAARVESTEQRYTLTLSGVLLQSIYGTSFWLTYKKVRRVSTGLDWTVDGLSSFVGTTKKRNKIENWINKIRPHKNHGDDNDDNSDTLRVSDYHFLILDKCQKQTRAHTHRVCILDPGYKRLIR